MWNVESINVHNVRNSFLESRHSSLSISEKQESKKNSSKMDCFYIKAFENLNVHLSALNFIANAEIKLGNNAAEVEGKLFF